MQLWERVTARFHPFMDQEVYHSVDRCSLNFKVPMISWPSGRGWEALLLLEVLNSNPG
ncbi:hypothetical protein HanRHA438_Chr05g0205701 [Helianthus annuus]|nr:hypothetical protein HanRHA438_Chr05g0205701 [Helianthus annuus]